MYEVAPLLLMVVQIAYRAYMLADSVGGGAARSHAMPSHRFFFGFFF